jgi:hypothetical protein
MVKAPSSGQDDADIGADLRERRERVAAYLAENFKPDDEFGSDLAQFDGMAKEALGKPSFSYGDLVAILDAPHPSGAVVWVEKTADGGYRIVSVKGGDGQ